MRTIKIKSYFFLLGTILSFAACTQNELTEMKDKQKYVEHSRVIFKSTDEFLKTYHNLAEMPLERQKQWIKSQNFTSIIELEEKSDIVKIEGPRAFKLIFNQDLEFQINDSVIWYNKGDLLVISTNGHSPFNKSEKKYPSFGQSEYKIISDDVPQTRLDHGGNYRGNHILQNITYGNYEYRYIAELSGHYIKYRQGMDLILDAGLFLSLRLDYRGLPKGKWANNSHTERDIYYDLNGIAYFTNGNHSGRFLGGEFHSLITDNRPKTGSGTIENPMIRVITPITTDISSNDRWYIQEIKGNIYQQLSGISSTRLYVPTFNNGVIWQ